MSWRAKLVYYWRYPVNRVRFPEIRGMTHKRYLDTFVRRQR